MEPLSPMEALLNALGQFGEPLRELVVALAGIVIPWTPLIAWIAFWLFAVNWTKLHATFSRGGWIGVALIGGVAVLVWGSIAPPAGGSHDFFGWTVTSTYTEKFVYVAGLICIMFLAGSLQLSGFTSGCCAYQEPVFAVDEDHGHGHDHGHDHGSADHGASHGHGDEHASHGAASHAHH